MLNGCIGKYFIRNEGTPCSVELFEMMKDYDFNEGMMTKTIHFIFIVTFLGNVGHIFNALEEIIRYVEHLKPCEMHE